MDTYVIRIHWRQESDPHTVAGTVEEPGIPKRKAFSNLDQLWDILKLKKKKMPKRKKILSGLCKMKGGEYRYTSDNDHRG